MSCFKSLERLDSILHHLNIEHVIAEDNSIQSDGFRLGAMSDDDFCQWVPRAPNRVQNAVVRHVTWWRSKKAPFHHQFVVLTFLCAPAERDGAVGGGGMNGKGGQPGALYDICLERIGKGMGFKALAEHRVTITPSKSLKTYGEGSTLLFGLISDDAAYLSQITTLGSHTVPVVFTDPLDIKWRGPPATLRHVAAYVYAIVHLSPRYSLASTNCYYFARLIVHLIGLRHHSFPYFAASDEKALEPRSERLDPSSIGTMFHFLDRETKLNGTLLYSRFRSAVCIVFATAMTTGFIYGLVRMFMALPTRASKIVMAFVTFFVMPKLYLRLLYIALLLLTRCMVVPFWNLMNSHTEKVIVALGE